MLEESEVAVIAEKTTTSGAWNSRRASDRSKRAISKLPFPR